MVERRNILPFCLKPYNDTFISTVKFAALEMLQNLSETIERELHVANVLTPSTTDILEKTVISRLRSKHPFMNHYSFHELVQHKSRPKIDSDKLLSAMQAFPKKLLQMIMHSIGSELKQDVVQMISNIIIIDAYELFPTNPELYLAYCVHKINFDKKAFIDTYIVSNNKFLKVTNDIMTSVFIYILSVLIVCGVLFIISSAYTQSNNERIVSKKHIR